MVAQVKLRRFLEAIGHPDAEGQAFSLLNRKRWLRAQLLELAQELGEWIESIEQRRQEAGHSRPRPGPDGPPVLMQRARSQWGREALAPESSLGPNELVYSMSDRVIYGGRPH
jgi:hypothetical protein